MHPQYSPLSYSQFINDKFLYDHSVAMEMLVQCGLKEQLLELAKVDLHQCTQEPLTIRSSVLRNSPEESSKVSVFVHSSLEPIFLLSDFYLQTHRRLPEVLGLLVKHGSMGIDPSLQSSLANKQYVDALCQAANGRVSPR